MRKIIRPVIFVLIVTPFIAVLSCGKPDQSDDESVIKKETEKKIAIPENMTPEGTWLNYSQRNGKPNAWIKIYKKGNKYYGRIVKILQHPPGKPNPVCEECEGTYKNKRILGMEVLWGFEKVADNSYKNGYILDVNNGKIYNCKFRLAGGGNKVKIRGYLKYEALGRTTTWDRVE